MPRNPKLKDVLAELAAVKAENASLSTRLAESETQLDKKSALIKQLQLHVANLEHKVTRATGAAPKSSGSGSRRSHGNRRGSDISTSAHSESGSSSLQNQFEGIFDPTASSNVKFDVDSPEFHQQVLQVRAVPPQGAARVHASMAHDVSVALRGGHSVTRSHRACRTTSSRS